MFFYYTLTEFFIAHMCTILIDVLFKYGKKSVDLSDVLSVITWYIQFSPSSLLLSRSPRRFQTTRVCQQRHRSYCIFSNSQLYVLKARTVVECLQHRLWQKFTSGTTKIEMWHALVYAAEGTICPHKLQCNMHLKIVRTYLFYYRIVILR